MSTRTGFRYEPNSRGSSSRHHDDGEFSGWEVFALSAAAGATVAVLRTIYQYVFNRGDIVYIAR